MLKRGRWGVRKERAEGRKAYSGDQEIIRERDSRHFSSPAFFMGSYNRSLVVQVALLGICA